MSNVQTKLSNYAKNPLDLGLTPNNMYLWGFLWADGYIKKPNRVALEIVTEDFDEIKGMLPSHFGEYHRTRPNRKPQSAAISSREDYVDFLCDNGYEDKQIPSQMLTQDVNSYYWFRGVVDGDGCWYFNPKYGTRQFIVASNINQDWAFFTNLLDSLECNYKVKLKSQKKNTQHYSVVRICAKDSLIKLHNYLYPNGFDLGLKRKYDKSLLCIV